MNTFKNYLMQIFILHSPLIGFTSSPDMIHMTPTDPWFTGPLLTPTTNVVPKGHYNIQPYLFFTNTYGNYNADWENRSVTHLFTGSFVLDIHFGLSKICDFQFTPLVLYKHREDIHTWAIGDIPISLGFQLYKAVPAGPTIKLRLLASLPTGKYQDLSMDKHGLDAGGLGGYFPGIALVIGRTFQMGCSQFLATRLSLRYHFPTPVHVKGLNSYGGLPHTRGKVFPGQFFISLLGLEWSFTQHFVLACDLEYTHINKTRFKRDKDYLHDFPHLINTVAKEQISIAPAIEYNFNQRLGIIAGCWFTIAGRNTPAFVSGIVSLNIYK